LSLPFSTRETVAGDTPATSATSRLVANRAPRIREEQKIGVDARLCSVLRISGSRAVDEDESSSTVGHEGSSDADAVAVAFTEVPRRGVAVFLTGVLLLRGHPVAPVLAAIALVKMLTLGLALLAMNAFMAASTGRWIRPSRPCGRW
jgi:hypothetical protein